MKKITKFLAAIALLGSVVSGMAQEYKTREVPKAPAFSAIEITGGDVNVYFSQGSGYSFSVSGQAKLVKAVKIKVKENTLFIDYNEPFFTGDDNDVTIYVTAPQLNRIAVAGEADFKTQMPFQGQELTIKTRQNGEVSMKNVTLTQVKIDAKGSSSVDIDYIQAQTIQVSSLDRAEVELSGSTGRFEVLKKGMFAEIDTKKLITTQTAGAMPTQQMGKDGSVEFVFND
jgi:hypothetical protein